MNPTDSDIRETMDLRQRAEERSKRRLMCAGYVKGPNGVVVYFPEPDRAPVIVARGEIEEVRA